MTPLSQFATLNFFIFVSNHSSSSAAVGFFDWLHRVLHIFLRRMMTAITPNILAILTFIPGLRYPFTLASHFLTMICNSLPLGRELLR
jgi:hypothetical protein